MSKYQENPRHRLFDKQIKSFVKSISESVSEFGTHDPDQLDRYNLGREDKHKFAHLYTPHYVDLKSAGYHDQLHAMTEYHKRRHLFIVPGPREHGKTIQLRIAKLHMILYGTRHYLLKVSEDLKLSKKDLSYIEAELRYNRRIQQDFEIEFVKNDDTTLQLKVTSKATGDEHHVLLEALSYGTTCIGLIFLQYRPDFADIDDFEDRKSARNPRISNEKVEWIMSQLLLSMSKKNGVIVWLGNNHAVTSAMNRALENEAGVVNIPNSVYKGSSDVKKEIFRVKGMVTGHVYPAWVRIGKRRFALWPEKMTIRELDQLREDIGAHRFEAEMQQHPIEVGNYFNADDMHETYDQLPPAHKRVWAGWIDQSLGKGKTSDYKSGWIVVTDGLYYYVVDGFLRQMSIRAMVKLAFELFEKWDPLGFRVWYIENNFGQYIHISKRDFDEEGERRGYPLHIKPENNTVDKDLRIQGMEPLFSGHKILFPKNLTADMKRLIEHTLGYPDFPFKDGPDGLSSSIERARKKSNKRKRPGYKSTRKRRYAKTRR